MKYCFATKGGLHVAARALLLLVLLLPPRSLQTCRQPIMSKFLTLAEGEAVLRKPFTSPLQGAPAMSDVGAPQRRPATARPRTASSLLVHYAKHQDLHPYHWNKTGCVMGCGCPSAIFLLCLSAFAPQALRRRLVARRHFVPWGSSTPLPVPTVARTPATPAELVPEPEPQPALQSAVGYHARYH